MNKIQIIGSSGQHAKDLIGRGIFDGFEISCFDINIQRDYDFNDDFVFLVPIGVTKRLIYEVISSTRESNANGSVSNLSGIMTTSPNGYDISNFHFLFGPKAMNNLRVIIAGELSESSERIISNVKRKNIRVINSTKDEHDKVMAYVQAFSHLVILLSGLQVSGSKELVMEWNTPTQTIQDMILLNPFFRDIFKSFVLGLDEGENITEVFFTAVSKNIDGQLIEDFSTPSFLRVLRFCKSNKVIITKEMKDFFGKIFSDRKVLGQTIDCIKRKYIQ